MLKTIKSKTYKQDHAYRLNLSQTQKICILGCARIRIVFMQDPNQIQAKTILDLIEH